MNNSDTKLWNFNFTYLLFLSAVTSVGFNMVLPLIPKYTLAIGGSIRFAGIIAGIYSLSAIIARPFSGVISDRGNKKLVLMGATLSMAVLVLAYGFCRHGAPLLLVRFLHGVAFGVSSTANTVFALNYVPKHRTGEGVGFLGMVQVLGQAIGPNIGAVLVGSSGYFTVFLFSFIICSLAALAMIIVRYEPTPSEYTAKKSKGIALSDFFARELIVIGLFAAAFSFCNGILSSYILIIGDERQIANISLYFTVYAFGALFSRPLAGKLADRKSLKFTVIPSFICASLAIFLVGMANSLWIVLLAGLFQSCGYGFGTPALQSQCLRILGTERSGVATGTYYTFVDIGYGIGPVIGGYIASNFGYSIMCFLTSIFLLCVFALFLLWDRRNNTVRFI